MNNKVKSLLIFAAGLLVGSAGGYLFAKKKYDITLEYTAPKDLEYVGYIDNNTSDALEGSEEDMNDVESVLEQAVEVQNNFVKLEDVNIKELNAEKDDSPIAYAKKFINKAANESAPTPIRDAMVNPEKIVNQYSNSQIYTIEPDQYGEFDDFGMEALTLTADGVIIDDQKTVIDDAPEILGDCLTEMGKYEDDAIHVRNEIRMCDYEVLRDLKTYDEILNS